MERVFEEGQEGEKAGHRSAHVFRIHEQAHRAGFGEVGSSASQGKGQDLQAGGLGKFRRLRFAVSFLLVAYFSCCGLSPSLPLSLPG